MVLWRGSQDGAEDIHVSVDVYTDKFDESIRSEERSRSHLGGLMLNDLRCGIPTNHRLLQSNARDRDRNPGRDEWRQSESPTGSRKAE